MFQHILVSLIIAAVPFSFPVGPDHPTPPVHRLKSPVFVEQSLPDSPPTLNVWWAGNQAKATQLFNEVVLVNTLVANQKKATEAARLASIHIPSPPSISTLPPGPLPSSSVASVMQCIKDHESGNYAESSHAGGASGAYQYEPGTWQTWSARAGYPGYTYAYQAPPAVQDAVTNYTLTHGGAGNWSTRFGADPCTASLPGGG